MIRNPRQLAFLHSLDSDKKKSGGILPAPSGMLKPQSIGITNISKIPTIKSEGLISPIQKIPKFGKMKNILKIK